MSTYERLPVSRFSAPSRTLARDEWARASSSSSNAAAVLAAAAAAAALPPPIAGNFDDDLPRGNPAVDALLDSLETEALTRPLPDSTLLAYASTSTTLLVHVERAATRVTLTASSLRLLAVRTRGVLGVRTSYVALVESTSVSDGRRVRSGARIEFGDDDALLLTLAHTFFGREIAQQLDDERARLLAGELADTLDAAFCSARALASTPRLSAADAHMFVAAYERTGVVHPHDADRLRLAYVCVRGSVPRPLRDVVVTPASSPCTSPPRLVRHGLKRIEHGGSDDSDDSDDSDELVV